MEFATRFFYVDASSKMQGIFKVSSVREFDQFLLKLELFKISNTDKETLNILKQQCEKNSSRLDLLNKTEHILDCSCSLNYFEVEQFYPQFGKVISTVKNDLHKLYNFDIAGKMKIIITVLQAKRLYFDMESFYKNYFFLETIFRMAISKLPEVSRPKITDKAAEVKREKEQTFLEPPAPPENQKVQQTVESTTFMDDILDCSISNIISTSLIHQVFAYYQYITPDNCNIVEGEDVITINCPSILPSMYIFDTDYFKNVILSIPSISTDNISVLTKRLLNIYYQDDTPLSVMMVSFLLYVYTLRILSNSHTVYFNNNFNNLISDVKLQIKALHNHIKIYANEFYGKIQFNISDIDVMQESSELSNIDEISKKYSHLITVSEEDFVKMIFKEQGEQDNLPVDFNFSKRKILDLNNMKANKIHIGNENPLFELGTQEINEESLMTRLLNYKLEGKIISKPFDYLLKYIQDPGSILMIEDLPKSIKNMFEVLKDILVEKNFKKENVNTLQFYKILCDLLPDVKVLSHLTVLFIIYQIIIPYYVYTYGVTKFIDQLL